MGSARSARPDSRSQPLTVAHLICPAPMGGAETVVRLLASGRARQGLPTKVFAIAGGEDHPFVTATRAAGVDVIVLPPLGRRYLKEIERVARLATDHGIDVIHTHVYRADYIGYFAARKAGITAVATLHGETGGDLMNRLYEWSVKRLFRRFDAVICVSDALCEKLRASGSDLSNAHVIRNGAAFEPGVDRAAARRELGVNGSDPIVGWIGRFTPEKGPDLLLDAARIMGRPVHLVLVGDGPMRSDLEARARQSGLRVTFAGSVPNASRLLKAFDLVALSSRMEGTPMVLLECMGAHVPVAAFLVGGIPAILSEETGWPAPPGDVGALARAISDGISDPTSAQRRAEKGAALAQANYSVDAWVDAVEAVYARAVTTR